MKVCATAAGRNDRGTKEFATVDWMAYQGAPNGGVTGNKRIPEWWTGTKCVKISLPRVSVPLCSLKSLIDSDDVLYVFHLLFRMEGLHIIVSLDLYHDHYEASC